MKTTKIRSRETSMTFGLMLTLLLASMLSMISNSTSSSEISHGFSQQQLKRMAPLDLYPRYYYQQYHDMDSWKRAPSAGFYGMRGKKVPSSNFYGMRGKKGPSGFLGMRGKKMDAYSQVDTSNELFSPQDSFENIWMPAKSHLERPSLYPADPELTSADDQTVDISTTNQQDRILDKRNLGKIINI